MIHHIVRGKFKPNIPSSEREEGLERLREQGRVIETVESWSVGRDVGGEFDFAAIYIISDLSGYETYMFHPFHQETDRLGLPLVDNFVSFDIVDDPDPDASAKIEAIHARRYAGDAELTDLIGGLGSYQGSGRPEEEPG